ncbi:RNA methyltransferase [Nanoarchaeota archaeon]
MISIILVEPKNSGNIGAIARIMKNFEFSELILVNPKVNHLSQTAKNRAKHAQEILKKAKVKKSDKKLDKILGGYDYLIGTTGKIGSDYNIPRSPITPEKLAEKLKDKKLLKKKIGLIFGRENKGLYNKEIQICDFVVHIPGNKKYPVFNLSHSIGIILYELFKKKPDKTTSSSSHIVYASKTEKDQLEKLLNKALNNLEFSTAEKKLTQKKVWKRLIGKSFLTKREAYALMGFFRKLI